MKLCAFLSVLTILLITSSPGAGLAASDTEFGERFTNQTPAALAGEDVPDNDLFAAETLNQITPAAGGAATESIPVDDTPATTLEENTDTDPRQHMGIEWQPVKQQD